MPQLHFYVSEDKAKELRRRAKAQRLPLSQYLARAVTEDLRTHFDPEWLERIRGSLSDDFERPEQPPLTPRDEF